MHVNTKLVKKLLDFDPVSKYVKYEIPEGCLHLRKEEKNMLGRGNFGTLAVIGRG
jgi:hypothetical protein